MATQPTPRQHVAERWHSNAGLNLRCACGQWESGRTGTTRDKEDAHRAHRVAMGETVKPRQPTKMQRLEAEIEQLQAEVHQYRTALQGATASREQHCQQVLTEAAELLQREDLGRRSAEFIKHGFFDHDTVLQSEAVERDAGLLLAARTTSPPAKPQCTCGEGTATLHWSNCELYTSQSPAARTTTAQEQPCHCGHTQAQHQGPDGLGGAQCLRCPGDEERAWRHSYTAQEQPR